MLKRRPAQSLSAAFTLLSDPNLGYITPETMLDFFTYRGAEISAMGVRKMFDFYSADEYGMNYNEFEYFLTFQRYYSKQNASEASSTRLNDTTLSMSTGFNYMEDEDVILELILREIMIFETLYESTAGLLVYAGFESGVRELYKQFVPNIHIDLRASHILDFLRQFTHDSEIETNVKHIMARFDISNDYIVDFKDFRAFFERVSSTPKEPIHDGDILALRTTRSSKRY